MNDNWHRKMDQTKEIKATIDFLSIHAKIVKGKYTMLEFMVFMAE